MSSAHEVEYLGAGDGRDDSEVRWPCPECFGTGIENENSMGDRPLCRNCHGSGIEPPCSIE